MLIKRFINQISNQNINITESAWNKISNILKQTQGCSFIFSAKGGGCNGFNYDFRSINKDEFEKIIFDSGKIKPTILENNKSKIIIDPLSEFLLVNTCIDYYEDIYESKFLFKRDKTSVTSCGCGTSFSIK